MEKESKIPEIPYIKPLHRVEGPPKETRAVFYEFAKDKIKYVSVEKMRKWQEKVGGRRRLTAASCFLAGKPGEWIDNLEIVVNKDAFNINEKDYSDLVPFVAEHEIYEAWLNLKKGTAPKLKEGKQHLLAMRREYLLAEQQGLGDKLFEWHTLLNPSQKEKSEYALKAAKKQFGRLKEPKRGWAEDF